MSFSTSNAFQFEQYQDADPSVTNGYTITFNKEIKFQINGVNKIYRTRVLTNTLEDSLQDVRVELFDDENIDFLFESSIAANEFDDFREQNQLSIKYEQLAQSIADLFEKSVKNPKEISIRFTFSDNSEEATIKFFQKLRLRSIEIFSLTFTKSEKEFIEAQAQARFNHYKNDLMIKKRQYEDLLGKIEAKNPTLAKRIRKGVEDAMKLRDE